MIDTLATLRTFLASQTALTTLTSTRLYAGRTYPPPDYTPGQYALCFNGRGGSIDYASRLISESFTFKCYGADELTAMTLYRTLVDVLHDKNSGNLRSAELEVLDYPLQEPDTGWHYTLTFFRVTFNSGV